MPHAVASEVLSPHRARVQAVTERPRLPDLSDPDVVGRLVVRARRHADLSQRDLASLVGVAASSIARLESAGGLPSLGVLSRILEACGLRLAAVDGDGQEVLPAPAGLVRDNAGRRFPAHLDVDPPDQVPFELIVKPRHDRPPAKGWFHHRPERDRIAGQFPWRTRPADHPTTAELALRRRLMAGRQPRVDPVPEVIDCRCLDECFELACIGPCPCQCEPAHAHMRLGRGQLPMRVRTS